MLLYAGDIVIMSETAEGLKHIFCLNIICDRCKLTVKFMIFRKGGRVNRNIRFIYEGNILEIVSKFTYLGIVFTTAGSFNTTFEM